MRETSLVQLEEYFNSKPYREHSMQKPYFPKTFYAAPGQTHRSVGSQNPSFVAYQELLGGQKDPVCLDRIAYKLRMKSDLNIDTLRETHVRRHSRRPRLPQQQTTHLNPSHHNGHDAISSYPSSIATKSTYPRQPTSVTVSTNTMKTMTADDLNGIEGSAVRVGTIDDLIKQFRRAEFRIDRRAGDVIENSSTQLSSEVSHHERIPAGKSHNHQERPLKQPQALTEYRFNAPTFPSTPTQPYREPSVHPGLIYQYRTRERSHHSDLPSLQNRTIITSEPTQRPNSLIIEDRSPSSNNHRDKRIQDSRDKTLTKTEKQVRVCSKLNIVDPFNSSFEQFDSNLPQIHQTNFEYQQQQQQQSQQQMPLVNYLFPPVRPFGYFTKKTSTNDDSQQSPPTPPPVLRRRKRANGKKRQNKLANISTGSLEKFVHEENFDDDESHVLNETVQSMLSITEFEDRTHNTLVDVQLNNPGSMDITLENPDESLTLEN